MSNNVPAHAEPPAGPSGPQIINPIAGSLNVLVSVPETIEIRMVDASVLADYEVWFFISSVLLSAVIGFFVAAIQCWATKQDSGLLFSVCGVFFLLGIISIGMTFYKRNKLRTKSKSIKLRVSEISS